jgi:glycosyltransferase involved in cell wall biosynthesis
MPRFSICIPTYDMGGYGHKYLKQMFDDLLNQTMQDFEVVISDQSTTSMAQELCLAYSDRLKIRYFSDFYNRGKAACNINQCMKYAEGEIIKIIYQDDHFTRNDALAIIDEYFKNGAKWTINAFTHSNEQKEILEHPRIPYYSDNVIIGMNSVGNPSNITVINAQDKLYMDESILYVVDCEYYFRLNQKYGAPVVIDQCLVSARYHPTSLANSPEVIALLEPEVNYCLKKHNLRVLQQ